MTNKGLGDTLAGDIDLENAMLSLEESKKQLAGEKEKTEEEEGYSKVYTKTHEKCAKQSMSRAERREQDEKHKREEAALKAAQEAKDRMAQDEAKHIIKRAQLEEEELAVQRRLEQKRKLQEMAEEKDKDREDTGETGPVTVSATSKKQWKEHLGLKARKCRREGEEEEEYCKVDDEDKDPDYQPDKDPEQDFIIEDAELDEEETFEIEKHVHAINLQEVGDYVVEIRRFVECFRKVVCKAKRDVAWEYRKMIHFMREMVLKIGAYGPVEHADEEAVYKTIVDPTCTAWRRAMHGAKTGNSKDIQRVEEKHLKVLKSVEEHKILPKEEMMDIAGQREECMVEDRQHVRDLIKHYWMHMSKAHEEAAAAASILRILADELDEQTYVALLNAGTRPLIMMEMPQMTLQALEMKFERERQEKAENIRNQPIGEIIKEQNVPVLVERWSSSSIMLPTQYLAAMVYYFVYAETSLEVNVTNKGMVALFKVSPSNLHKLVSGKKYHGGSHGDSKKGSSLKEVEEHGEPMVQVIKKKTVKSTTSGSGTKSRGKGGKPKSSGKVTVTKTAPKIIPLPFWDDETLAAGTRGARKKKKEDNE